MQRSSQAGSGVSLAEQSHPRLIMEIMDRWGKILTAVLLLGVAGLVLWDSFGRAKDITRPLTHAVDSGAGMETMYDPPEHIAYEASMAEGRKLESSDPRMAADKYRAAWHIYSFQQRSRCWFDAAMALSRALSESQQGDEALVVAREAKEVASSNADFFRWNGLQAYTYAAYAQNCTKHWTAAEITCRTGMSDSGIERSLEEPHYRALLRQFTECLLWQRKFAEVEPMLRELHRKYEEIGPKRTATEEDELIYLDFQFSADLKQQGRSEEAIPPVVEALDLLTHRKPFAAHEAEEFKSCSELYIRILMDQKLPREEILKRTIPLHRTLDQLKGSSGTARSISEPAPKETPSSSTSNPMASRRA
jgi:hypothetical protein